MVKDYNEDRVSIIMNITKPNYKGRWPKCSYFGVFDGHGGDACSNFLER
jgi:protein phosphatase 2C family protein 2/3